MIDRTAADVEVRWLNEAHTARALIDSTPVIYRCKTKGCDRRARRVLFSRVEHLRNHYPSRPPGTSYRVDPIKVWKHEADVVYLPDRTIVFGSQDERKFFRYCPSCSNFIRSIAEVEGTYDDGKTCNSRCLNAVGGACSCSCGGRNHGGAHT